MSKVKRSTYQKVVEENKRLVADIRVLVKDHNPEPPSIHEFAKTVIKWRDKFHEEREFNRLIKNACIKYFEEHPEEHPELKIKSSNTDVKK